MILVHGGVWSKTCRLDVVIDRKRGEWATEVRESAAGSIQGFSMIDLVAMLGTDQTDILKIDIEGSEREVFRSPAAWLSMIGCLMIELHGPEAESIVSTTCDPHLARDGRRGEIAIWQRRSDGPDGSWLPPSESKH